LRDLATMSTFQVMGNVVLLAPLGLLLPVRFTRLASVPSVLMVAALCSASIETVQYVLPLDRVASIDDVLLNTAGAGLGALASRPWWRPGRTSGRGSHAATAGEPAMTAPACLEPSGALTDRGAGEKRAPA
jgi:hypothetical protein